ncbi:MAG: hypothetical protein R3B82_20390 [Sandaracinaceae bacterium]
MDEVLLLAINGLRAPGLDAVMKPLSSWGIYAFPLAMLFSLIRSSAHARSIRDGWLTWFLSMFVAEQVLKPLIARPRPTAGERLRDLLDVLGSVPPPSSLAVPLRHLHGRLRWRHVDLDPVGLAPWRPRGDPRGHRGRQPHLRRHPLAHRHPGWRRARRRRRRRPRLGQPAHRAAPTGNAPLGRGTLLFTFVSTWLLFTGRTTPPRAPRPC